MRELTPGRNFTNVVNVKRLFASTHTLVNITGFILEKNLMIVWNVGNPLDTVQHFFGIKNFMLEDSMRYNQCHFSPKLLGL